MDIGTVGVIMSIFNNGINNDKAMAEPVRANDNFNLLLEETAIENVKTDIYNKFNIKVNMPDGREDCTIPRSVLYKMNSDAALREKIYEVLADYKNTKSTLASYYNEIINQLLNGSYQNFETQQAMAAAYFLQRSKINLTN